MHNHPFAERRFAQAHEKFRCIDYYFESGDSDAFIKIVERKLITHAIEAAQRKRTAYRQLLNRSDGLVKHQI
jgi:hypothetical protein